MDVKDQACQTVYSLTIDQLNGDFDQYATAFRLAQAYSRGDLDSILVDALQQGVTNQLAVMITAAALPDGQAKAEWKWKQWLNKAGEFYQNMVWLRKLWGGSNSYILPAQTVKYAHPARDPYAMDINKINLSPRDRAKHIHNCKCFIYHKEGCHLSKHKEYPKGRGKPPQQGAQPSWRAETREVDGDPQVTDFMKQKGISVEKALNLLGNYYSQEPATTWDGPENESVALVLTSAEGFRKGRMDQHHDFPQTFGPYL